MRIKTKLTCPCGTRITGANEDDLVHKVQTHLAEVQSGMEYSRDEILFVAY